MKVLIAEDDPASRLLLETVVRAAGHEVVAAEDGDQGWRLFREVPDVDVVISDWMMPNMDGLDFCRRVRSIDRQGYTYFVLVTALDDTDHVVRGIENGADEYLTKPLDRAQLRARLQSAARLNAVHRMMNERNSRLQRLNEQLQSQCRTDPLTGLGNRLRMREDLDALTDQAKRYGHRFCLLLCDIDEFKSYNDHYGHQAGDEALRKVGQTLTQQCRAGDSAYRYGGEELLAVLPEQSISGGIAFAERLRRSVENLRIPHERATTSPLLTLSIGVAAHSTTRAPGNADDVLRKADAALYRAKNSGRNRVATYNGASED
jgi:two-component system cell cycle response regulator